MSYSDEVKKQRIADDWRLRMEGPKAYTSTLGGQMEAKRLQSLQPKPSQGSYFPPVTPYTAPSVRTPSLPNAPFPNSPYSPAPFQPGRQQRVQAPSAPMFPFVDDAFKKVPKALYWILLIVGAIFGLGYAGSHGASGAAAIGDAVLGAFGGLMVIPALRAGVKILLAAASLAIVAFLLYCVYEAVK